MVAMRSKEETKNSIDVYSKDARFEIFTPNEISIMLASVKDESLQKAIKYTTTIINQGMHNRSVGWYTKLCANVAKLEKEMGFFQELKEIIPGALTYLEAANRLQASKEGTLLYYTAARGNEKGSLVNVYQRFWNDCFGAVPCSFTASVAEAYHQKSPIYGKEKIYIYALLEMKASSLRSFGDDERIKIRDKVDSALKAIYMRDLFPKTFILNEKEVKEVQAIHQNQRHKLDKLTELRELFESTAIAKRYVHVRPAVLAQFADALNYLYKHIEEHTKDSRGIVASLFSLLHKQAPAALAIIERKRQEIVEMMKFQEMLLNKYHRDDFIEVLHEVIGTFFTNVFDKIPATIKLAQHPHERAIQALQKKLSDAYLTVLPPMLFFDFDKQQNIQVVEYDSEDSDAPRPIKFNDLSAWRKEFIRSFSSPNKVELKEDKENQMIVTEVEKESEVVDGRSDEIQIVTSSLYVVFNLVAMEVQVPTVVLSNFYHLRSEMPDVSESAIFQFFIVNAQERKIFLQAMQDYTNNYQKTMDFLVRQVRERKRHHILFDSTSPRWGSESTLFNHAGCDLKNLHKLNFSTLIACAAIFHDAQAERVSVIEAMKAADEMEKFAFMKYLNQIDLVCHEFHEKFNIVTDYWKQYTATARPKRFEMKQIKCLEELINNAINMLKEGELKPDTKTELSEVKL
ncbi:MAG: hypothetical protein ACYCQI_13465 [Gammaproteobacteria bacterium]